MYENYFRTYLFGDHTLGGEVVLRYVALLLTASFSWASPTFAQSSAEPTLPASSTVTPSVLPVLLRQDTPIELMATKEVSTADVTAGTRFKLRVNKPVVMDGKTVIPVGAVAYGEVTDAIDSGGLGKSGRMTAKLLYVQTGDAQILLSGDVSAKGTGAGSAGLAILFTGWAGFFHRGNNAKIKAGEILTGFIADDAWLDVVGTIVHRTVAPANTSEPNVTLVSAVVPAQ